MTITTRIYTALFGEHIGTDAYGNRYFRRKGRTLSRASINNINRREKRWVVYNGMAEPSKVPPEWHGWLHYTLDAPPNVMPPRHHAWEKPPQPNLSGTRNAYIPPGHLNALAQHAPNTAEYEPWKP